MVVSKAIPLSIDVIFHALPSQIRTGATPDAKAARRTRLRDSETDQRKQAQFSVAAGRSAQTGLAGPGAAALNQDPEHDGKQHAGNNLDNRDIVHKKFLLSSVAEKILE